MRAIVLDLVVFIIAIGALIVPRVGLYGYVWFGLMRPDVLAWSYGTQQYSMVMAIPILLGSLRYLPDIRVWFANPFCRGLLALQAPLALSVLFAVVPALCSYPFQAYERVVVMGLLIPLLVRQEEHFRNLFLIMAFSLGFLGSKLGYWGVLHGGVHLTEGWGGMLSGNNEIALAMAMAVPLCWYARRLEIPRWAKWMFLVMTFGCIATVVMSHSRGGAVALVAALLFIVLREQRRVAVMVVFAALVAPSVYLVKDSYLARLETLQSPMEESSAASRIEYAQAAFAMWKDYPILGVGYGQENYVRLSAQYLGRDAQQVVHNTYMQVLVDSGIFAFLMFIGLMLFTVIWLGMKARKLRGTYPTMRLYLLALQAAIAAFGVGCTFGSREGYDFYYILIMCAASCYEILRNQHPGSLQEPDENIRVMDTVPAE